MVECVLLREWFEANENDFSIIVRSKNRCETWYGQSERWWRRPKERGAWAKDMNSIREWRWIFFDKYTSNAIWMKTKIYHISTLFDAGLAHEIGSESTLPLQRSLALASSLFTRVYVCVYLFIMQISLVFTVQWSQINGNRKRKIGRFNTSHRQCREFDGLVTWKNAEKIISKQDSQESLHISSAHSTIAY